MYLNTGRQVGATLRQVAVYPDSTRVLTGVTKPNNPADPDYIPYIDTPESEAACPPPSSCGTSKSFSGTGIYYPKTFDIYLGDTIGDVIFSFNAGPYPDKFVVRYAGAEVINTGYVGSPSYQSALDAALASLGHPPETIVDSDGHGTGTGAALFSKSSSVFLYAHVDVYSVFETTGYFFTMYCPGITTTTTSTTTTTTLAP